MRAGLLFLVLFTLMSALIFGYKYITKNDIKVAGKLTVAAILSLIVSTIIFVLETG